MREHLSLNDDLSRRWNLQIHSFTLDQRYRRALQSSGDLDLTYIRRQHHAAHKGNHRLPADRHRHRHGFVHRFILLIHLADMLLRRKQTPQRVAIVHHQSVHAPVHPRAVWVLGDYRVPGSDIASAVTAVNQRNRKLEHIDCIT